MQDSLMNPDISKFIFLLLLIAATYTSYRQAILPHKLTLGGVGGALLLSILFPQWWGETSRLASFGIALLGFFAGLLSTWILIELGKYFFGKKNMLFTEPVKWNVKQPADDLPPVVNIGNETYRWEDVFMRATDCMLIKCATLHVSGKYCFENVVAHLKMETLELRKHDGHTELFELQNITSLEGTTHAVVMPREVMGFGVALLSAMTGTFLGPKLEILIFGGALLIMCLVTLLYVCSSRARTSPRLEIAPFMLVSSIVVLILRHYSLV